MTSRQTNVSLSLIPFALLLIVTIPKGWIPIRRYPAFLAILISVISALTLPYPEHLGPACGAYTLSRWFTILHGYGLSILHFLFGTAFHTVCLHFYLPPFLIMNDIVNDRLFFSKMSIAE